MIRDIAKKIRRLLGFMSGARTHLALGLMSRSAGAFLSVWMVADLLGNATRAFELRSTEALIGAALRALPYLVAIMLLNTASVWLTGAATARAAAQMRRKLMKTMLNTSLGSSNMSHSGRKLSYFTNDIPAAMNSLADTLSVPLDALFIGIGGLFYVLSVHWGIAAIAIGIGIFSYVYSVLFASWLHRIAARMQAYMAELESRLKDLLDGMVVARIYGMREKLNGQMEKASGDLMDTGILWARASALLGGINNMTHYFSEKLLVFAAGWLMLSGSLELPELMRVSQMAGGVIGVFGISRLLVEIQRSLAGAERVFDFIDGADYELSGQKTGVEGTAIRFEDVSFSYSGAISTLKGLSFSINEGEMAAFIGSSGSGKSTILRLAQGLYRPNGGTVEICGTPLEEWDLRALRGVTALVPQEPVLFPGSVAENIALGMGAIDMEKMECICAQAGAHDFISAMPDGYRTQVTERGSSLSGGQRQRIAIARALYRDAPIILLDEATSAMDSESEELIYNTLANLKGKKTILFITHRTSILDLADRVIQIS